IFIPQPAGTHRACNPPARRLSFTVGISFEAVDDCGPLGKGLRPLVEIVDRAHFLALRPYSCAATKRRQDREVLLPLTPPFSLSSNRNSPGPAIVPDGQMLRTAKQTRLCAAPPGTDDAQQKP